MNDSFGLLKAIQALMGLFVLNCASSIHVTRPVMLYLLVLVTSLHQVSVLSLFLLWRNREDGDWRRNVAVCVLRPRDTRWQKLRKVEGALRLRLKYSKTCRRNLAHCKILHILISPVTSWLPGGSNILIRFVLYIILLNNYHAFDQTTL